MFHWVSFLTYAVVTAVTPGPNNLMSMSNGSRWGFRGALPFNFGIWAGFSAVMLLCTAFCSLLSALIPRDRLPMLVLGAAYMLFLAWETLRGGELTEDHSHSGFWSGLLLVMLFSLTLGILPSQGMGTGFGPMLKSLVLPSLTLGINSAAMVARMTRSSMLEVIRQDYISTARAKGVSERVITFQHMLRNALIPIITAVGLQFGTLLGGAMLAETVFSWPGLGRLMVESIKSKDIPMVLGCVIFMATMFTIVNLLVDIVYAFVDPRIKSLYKKGR